MHDILFRLPLVGIPIHSYGFMAMLGFIAALLVARWRAKTVGISADAITDVALWALIGGIAGSRIFHVLQNADYYLNPGRPGWSFFNLFKLWEGGLVFYGGFIGAVAAAVIVVRVKKLRLIAVLDVLAPSTALGGAFGRIGCFLRGCCYGVAVRAETWYGITFPENAPAYEPTALKPLATGTPVFPSQIVSTLDLLVIFTILSFFFKRRRGEGQVIALYLILYSIHRFTIEFFRSDTHLPGQMSPAQWISIFLVFIGLGLMIHASGRVPAPEKGKAKS